MRMRFVLALLLWIRITCAVAQKKYDEVTLVVRSSQREVRTLADNKLVRVSNVPTTVRIGSSTIVFEDSTHTDTVHISTITQRRGVYTYNLDNPKHWTIETPPNFMLDIAGRILIYFNPLTGYKVILNNVTIGTIY